MMPGLTYSALLSLFLVHELDAVAQREWRLLPVFRRLPEAKARAWFIGLHVPLVAAILIASYSMSPNISDATRLALAGFAILHIGLHWMFRNHPDYSFTSVLSKALILGPGLIGAAYIGMFLL